jgi:nucleoside-diphosphate-sugar epimerase
LGHSVDIWDRKHLESDDRIEGHYDYIFHLAAYGQHINQRDDVDEIYNTNVIKLLKLLKASNHIKYKAFINIGTSSEYGVKNKPMKETDLLEPDFYYASSKAAGTLLCQAWAKVNNKPIVTVRPFSLYGGFEEKFRFIPKLMMSAINGTEMEISGGSHDWIFVTDFIEAMMLVVKNIKKLKGKIVNIGTGKQYYNWEVVEIVDKMTNGLNVVRGKKRHNDMNSWVADTKLIRSLGWKPRFTLKKGLEETMQYYLPY